nr:efflux RND transporter permease subunit [uncultured Brumimicrobium sp.]
MKKFIQNIIAFSLKNSIIVFFLTGVLIVTGIISLVNTPIEAFPDVTNTRARIITQWPERSAEEVKKFITLPLMKEKNTIPKKAEVRPIVMIALMGSMRLFPAALSTGMGSEIQKPLPIMIVGGLLICMILSLTVLPQIFYWSYKKEDERKLNHRRLRNG